MLGLWSEGRNITKLSPELEKYVGKPVDIVVKGRLATRSGLYIVSLPWRKDRPLGRYLYGGVPAAIEVSEIKVIPASASH